MSSTKLNLRVGSADDADIVIKQATVSRYHCELRWKSGAWELRDLDSTNGTYVDGIRITEARRLSPASVVTLGRGIALEMPSAPVAASKGVVPETQPITREVVPLQIQVVRETSTNNGLYVFGTAAVMLLFGVVIWLLVQSSVSRDASSGLAGTQSVGTAVQNEKVQSPPAERAPSTAVSPSAPQGELDPKLTLPTEASKSAPELVPYDAALWAVIVESSDGQSQRLLGTAIAIGPKRLITLASIVEAFESVKSAYPRLVFVQPANTSKRLVPVQIDVHPNNKAALAKYEEFEKRLAEKVSSVKELKEPSLEESLEWSGQLEAIMADIAKSDLASVTIAEPLSKFLSIGMETMSNQTTCIIRGFPMILPSPDVQSNLTVFYLDLPGNCRMDTRAKQPVPLVESADVAGIPMISMVCLNQKSEVIGLCVREEPVQDLAAPKRSQISRVEVFW